MRTQLFVISLVLTAATAVAQTTPANPQSQSDQKSGQPAASPQSNSGELPQMKTSAFKGVLVDMSCAAGATSSTSTSGSATSAAPAKSANPSAGDSASNCAVSAGSSKLGMKLDDGRTVRFDLVGNQRAVDALKNDKRWSKNLADGKPIHAKAIGALNGDKLIVASIQ